MQLFDVDGFLDLYVGAPLFWGFELLRDGDGITEHTHRFLPGGQYYKMVENGQLREFVVLDMRAVAVGNPRRLSVTTPDHQVDVIRVCFKDEYQKAIVHGLSAQPEEIVVGRQQRADSMTSTC